ncbi:cation:proton antiporter [Reinekea blandensis]|uniref:Kef-type K+ transport system, predicted NAD-binding component n=1 Tax=Reinekea blandensis MED297 TaxID=314283 RepID=A4BHK9_9GAMM|nr:cation:proton antiporter [Reinekea blandensis]EAR08407.1 Kef-type K+ transport system, predicted NAD-binding component [Reinekea blandensis MED297]
MFFSFFLIFSGAAALATVALYTRQPLLIAYIFLGVLTGPYGFGVLEDTDLLGDISEIGIIFLLFLLGLDMQLSNLLTTMRKSLLVGVLSCVCFAGCGFFVTLLLGFHTLEAMIIGLCLMFSSTIIGIKLLPTTVLHHRHAGELMVGILLIQDFIAILVLLAIESLGKESIDALTFIQPLLMLPILIGATLAAVKWIILPLLTRFDRFHEYIFLLTIGWCLGIGEVAKLMGLSHEIGAFIAGISLASSPIAQFIALNLKPLRDFFLILFFFTLGAQLNIGVLSTVWLPMVLLTILILAGKPIVFRFLLHRLSESNHLAWDIGFRLGQISEFSLLVTFLAQGSGLLSERAAVLVQSTAIATFALSSYIIVFNFQNPIAVSDRLRRD